MSATKLENHSTSLILLALQDIAISQGFKLNEDMSDTVVGKLKQKEFKVFLSESENVDVTSRQNLRMAGTFEYELFHNAQNGTAKAQRQAMDDTENLIFDIERFTPTGTHANAKDLIHTTKFDRFKTDPIKKGDDSRLKTTLIFTIVYRIKNPAAT